MLLAKGTQQLDSIRWLNARMHSKSEAMVATGRKSACHYATTSRRYAMLRFLFVFTLHAGVASTGDAFQPSPLFQTGASCSSRSLRQISRLARRYSERNTISRPPSTATSRRKDASCFVVSPASGMVSGDMMAWSSMSLLALQFACQPILTKTFATPKLVRTTYVIAQDALRFALCAFLLTLTCGWSGAAGQWTLKSSLIGAGLPASLYAIQNYCSLMAYQNLAPISYNVLNQTKTLSAAFFCFALLGKPQSRMQILSLFLLLGSALIMEKVIPIRPTAKSAENTDSTQSSKQSTSSHFSKGVLPILLGSLISGLAGTLCQQTLQDLERNVFLFSMEISVFSSLTLLASLCLGNPDLAKIRKGGITQGWTRSTWIPLLTTAIGGILVGLVTKYTDSVRKGFALVVGLLLSGLLQNRGANDSKVSLEQWAGGALAGIAIWMHLSFPVIAAAVVG